NAELQGRAMAMGKPGPLSKGEIAKCADAVLTPRIMGRAWEYLGAAAREGGGDLGRSLRDRQGSNASQTRALRAGKARLAPPARARQVLHAQALNYRIAAPAFSASSGVVWR